MIPFPPPVVERVSGFLVVRDDLIPGGTKTRALDVLLTGADEFVFGSPAQGYAQVALSYRCAALGKRATVFVAQRKELHQRTAEAAANGARIVQVPAGRMSVVQHRARTYAADNGARFFPLGYDLPEFIAAMAEVARALPLDPPEVWCVAGTGALSRALQSAWPKARHVAVAIGFEPNVGNARLLRAPEKFAEPALLPPPFPSCDNYDAKAWQFFSKEASPGALFWNVAP